MKLLLVVVTLLVSASAMAATLDVYIATTQPATQTVSGGQIRYVNSFIGSNETASQAMAHVIFNTLTVVGANGATVCSVSVEKAMVLKPPAQPLRFRIFYPTPTLHDKPARGTRKYTVHTKFTMEDPQSSVGNDKHQFTFDFPSGGTPSCIKN